MTMLNNREQAFESKFALDAEADFRQRTAKHRAAGLWAAGLMHHDAPDAYATTLVRLGMQPDGERAIFDRLFTDLKGHCDAAEIRQHLAPSNGQTVRTR